jgi:hypothetical protein
LRSIIARGMKKITEWKWKLDSNFINV